MKKLLIIALLLAAGALVFYALDAKAGHFEPYVGTGTKVIASGVCEGEPAALIVFEGMMNDRKISPEGKALFDAKVCVSFPLPIRVMVYRVVSQGHDWDGDPFLMVEYMNKTLDGGSGYYGPLWEHQILPNQDNGA